MSHSATPMGFIREMREIRPAVGNAGNVAKLARSQVRIQPDVNSRPF